MTNKIKHRISSKMLNGLVAPKFKKLRSMAVCLVLTVLSLTAIPAAAQTTGTLTIGTTVVVPDLTQDGSGTGWTWNAATSTFTVATLANINGQIAFEREGDMTFILNGNVTGNVVFVGVGGTNGGAGGNVNFTVSGLRSIDGGIVCTRGRLTISGAGGGSRLSVTRTSGEAIYAQNGLTIGNIVVSATVAEGNATAVRVPSEGFTMASGSLNASGRLQGISIGGDANISGTAAVTAVSRSNGGTSDDVAMFLSSGSLTIGGSATVTANGYSGTGIWCSRGITINGGNVTALGNAFGIAGSITVSNNASLTAGNAGVNPVNGNILGSLVVDGADANATIHGNISRDLTLSAGTVTISGAVMGVITQTGGTLIETGTLAGISGSGTATDPYTIHTSTGLTNFKNFVNAGEHIGANIHWQLHTDIAWSNPERIGFRERPFRGHFNGRGYTVTFGSITYENDDYVGFFGQVNGATIRNLNIVAQSVNGRDCVGGLIGEVLGTVNIENVHVHLTGTSFTNGNGWGGLVGQAWHRTDNNLNLNIRSSSAIVYNLFSTPATNTDNGYGGLIGKATSNATHMGGTVTITDCMAVFNMTGNTAATSVGGMIGVMAYRKTVTMRRVYARSNFSNLGSALRRGDLVGAVESANTLNAVATVRFNPNGNGQNSSMAGAVVGTGAVNVSGGTDWVANWMVPAEIYTLLERRSDTGGEIPANQRGNESWGSRTDGIIDYPQVSKTAYAVKVRRSPHINIAGSAIPFGNDEYLANADQPLTITPIPIPPNQRITYSFTPDYNHSSSASNNYTLTADGNNRILTTRVNGTVNATVIDLPRPHPDSELALFNHQTNIVTISWLYSNPQAVEGKHWVFRREISPTAGAWSLIAQTDVREAQDFTVQTIDDTILAADLDKTFEYSICFSEDTPLSPDDVIAALRISVTVSTDASTVKTVSVGAQNGIIIAGTAGSVTFPVTTANIANGTYTAAVANLPPGVTVLGNVNISNDAGTLTLANTAAVAAGTYNLRLTIDGVQSEVFTLTVSEAGVKAVLVGSQNSTVTAGTAGMVTFPVWTVDIANGTYLPAVANLPPGVTLSSNVAISNNAGTLTLAYMQGVPAGTYNNLRLIIDGVQSEAFTLTVSEAGAVKTVSVSAQIGIGTAGTAASVMFPVTTGNIANGTYEVTVANLPGGVTVGNSGNVAINNNAGTLVLEYTEALPAGTYNNLRLTIDGVQSEAFTLVVNAPVVKTVSVGNQTGIMTAGTAGSVLFPVTTTNIANGTYTAAVSGLPAGVSVVSSVMINANSGAFMLTNTAEVAAGTYNNLRLTIDGVQSEAFTLTVSEEGAAPTYTVTVNGGTGGGEYEAGATVHIQAAPPTGEQFVNWTVVSGNITLDNANHASTSFTMPANAVTLTANFEPIPVENHAITVTHTGNGIANANVQSAPQGASITLTATPDAGNRFVRWEVVSGGIIIAANNTFTMPNNAVAVRAIFEHTATGIAEIKSNADLKIYPNPVKDDLRIESGELTIRKVEILDLSGRTVVNLKSGNVNSIDVSALSSGVYLVKIETDKGVVIKKIVKE